MDIWLATSCDFAAMEMRMPRLRPPKRNTPERAIIRKTLL